MILQLSSSNDALYFLLLLQFCCIYMLKFASASFVFPFSGLPELAAVAHSPLIGSYACCSVACCERVTWMLATVISTGLWQPDDMKTMWAADACSWRAASTFVLSHHVMRIDIVADMCAAKHILQLWTCAAAFLLVAFEPHCWHCILLALPFLRLPLLVSWLSLSLSLSLGRGARFTR